MTDNYLHPGPDNMAAFMALPDDTPINMVNFLRYRELAEYPDGHEHVGKGWSGRRAYEEYGRAIVVPFTKVAHAMYRPVALFFYALARDKRAAEV